MSRPVATRLLPLVLLGLAPVAVFAGMVAADRVFGAPGRGLGYVVRLELRPPGREIGLPPVEGPLDAGRPLVVLDAGHGGHDPGSSAPGTHGGAIKEKAVTLALAEALRDRLLKQGGIRVALTRREDRFLLLSERAAIARRLKADLFISIHADSAADPAASGATIYTLSDRGSSEAAARLAIKENRADSVNGVALGDKTDAVSAILVDLSQRETEARSLQFARLVLREGTSMLRFRERGIQSAAFAVLKSADLPSVLFEAGYLSNPGEAAQLASAEGRDAFAAVTARAISIFFARSIDPGAPAATSLRSAPPAAW
ncbi:MAG: N-acetylmuramoyl-L-alanine amidase [Pseudomonadota bacterium]